MWEQFRFGYRPNTAASALLITAVAGLFLSACASAGPRSGDEDYSDAATKQKETKAQATRVTQDASTADANDSKSMMIASQDTKSTAQACGGDSCKEPAICKADH
jgi:outer membrane biogenesis lipoprotein LolB